MTDRRREHLAVAGLMALALVLRVLHVLAMEEHPHHQAPILDSAYHVEWARALAAGEVFAPLADRPFFRAPLYVWFLAGIFAVFGDDLLVARLIQCLLGTVSVGLVYLVGRRAFDGRVGLVAAALAASYWVLVHFDGELLIPTLIVPLDLLALWLTLGLAGRPRSGPAALAGLVWGVSAIARPNVLLFVPCVGLWLLWCRRPAWTRGLVPAAAFTAAVLAPVLPITAYNGWVKGDLVLISSQAGVNFWIGNNPDSNGLDAVVPGTRGGWWEGYHDSIAQAERAEGRALRASEVSRHYAGRAWDFIRSEPGAAAALFARKLRLFWAGWEYGNNEAIHFFAHRYGWLPHLSIGFPLLAAFGLLGAALSLREAGRLFPLWGFLLVYTLGVVAFFVCARFRVPVLPVLMVFAAHAGFELTRDARAGAWRRLAVGGLFVAGFAAWSWAQAPPRALAESNGHLQLGTAERARGELEVALGHFERALELVPRRPEVRAAACRTATAWALERPGHAPAERARQRHCPRRG